ncbi:hypothetical protein J3P80_04510 [Pseudomonas sp. D2-30]|uniref:hypothetical protein n=1 Tax=unclassified Pseudomonas TaxID=196821 RepID=UPI003DA9F792
MYAPLFASHSQRLVALKKTRVDFAVQVLLGEALEGLEVNPHNNYLNTLTDVSGAEVVSSVTLFDEALACVEKQLAPHYTQGVSEVFSKRYSFAAEDRIKGLDVIGFERIVIDIVSSLTDGPSMDLSRPGLKSLAVADLESILKDHLPGIDLNETYVTGFAPDGLGGRVITSSQKLADYLLAHFDDDNIPFHAKGDHQAVYTVAFSGEARHAHPQLTTGHLNDLLIRIVPHLLG